MKWVEVAQEGLVDSGKSKLKVKVSFAVAPLYSLLVASNSRGH